ncbi:MAG TPA: S9 family peptidase [Chitinophagaceae bacterium]|nr:S9 family peptidase [Chitinophagaceae bacterium]
MKSSRYFLTAACVLIVVIVSAQGGGAIKWSKDGNSYYRVEAGEIVQYVLPGNTKTVVVPKDKLTPAGQSKPLTLNNYAFTSDGKRVLIFTNTKRVWRYNTRGDYWLLDLSNNSLKQLGKGRPASSLMFAKISPDGKKAAYVSEYNLYVEDLATGTVKPLTIGGHRKLINGTFDWPYEEEFFCRDGFRWSPDSRQIGYWQIDARKVKDYLMINLTDSIYPVAVPVEYPVAGEPPSPFKIGVVDIATAKTKWMNIPYDATLGAYAPRMEWAGSKEVIVQHMNRRQNETKIMLCDVATGQSRTIYEEKDPAWIDIIALWDFDYQFGGWDWLNNGKEFVWASEKDGWRHLYRISRDGKSEKLITNGNYDVMDIAAIDEKSGYVYFFASPDNATQKYLYRTRLDGSGAAERLSPSNQQGTHGYNVSPTGAFAYHTFSNHYTQPSNEWVSLPDHKALNGQEKVNEALAKADKSKANVEFFKVKTDEAEMDAWVVKPANFDSTKKYPIVFFVYTEPWGQEVKDQWNITNNFLYQGDMAKDGYFYVAIDNRGTPVPKGRAWRKSVHKKIGLVNIKDQAMAAREIFKWPYIDTSRVAVWGWSGGGAATLNLMFQYPDIYKTGISVAAVTNQLTYDNIYQERYMGLPQENRQDFINGSPMTYAKNLRGNLLIIHGTGDDNVHYNNAEMLLNELIKHNKQFQYMPYPNRTHGISEGEGTFQHLSTLYTNFLKRHCPPGPKQLAGF